MGTRKNLLRSVLIVITAAAFFYGAIYLPSRQVAASTSAGPAAAPTPPRRRSRAARTKTPAKAITPKITDFPHSAKAHRLECSTCHKFPSANWNKVRDEKDAFPDQTDYPHHETCVGCHKRDFFRGRPPKVCSICHTDPGPRNSNRWPFPNPRELFDQSAKGKVHESDFVVGFPHDIHIDIVSQNVGSRSPFVNASFVAGRRLSAGEESCAVCHKIMAPQGDSDEEYLTKPPADLGDGFWLKKGTFKTAPIGHTVCFTCHNADTGILPDGQSCGTCHHLKPSQPPSDFDPKLAAAIGVDDKVMLDAWRIRHNSGTFRHEFIGHVDLESATCHNVLTMNTADPTTIKIPVSACATCHATATLDDGGALNYEVDQRKANPAFQCVKCHITFGKQPVPESHIKTLAEAAGS